MVNVYCDLYYIYITYVVSLYHLIAVSLHVRCIPEQKIAMTVLIKRVTHAGFVMVA